MRFLPSKSHYEISYLLDLAQILCEEMTATASSHVHSHVLARRQTLAVLLLPRSVSVLSGPSSGILPEPWEGGIVALATAEYSLSQFLALCTCLLINL